MSAEKFQNRYKIDSARAAHWDYGWNASYFVTICTHNRVFHFGDVVNSKMQLSDIGMIANSCWLDIPNHFPFVELGAFIVMPDHVHGIVTINKKESNIEGMIAETQNIASRSAGKMNDDRKIHLTAEIPKTDNTETKDQFDKRSTTSKKPKNSFGPQSQNLGSIIRGFKIGVTIGGRKIDENFKWQSRFHDRIIRSPQELERISAYIQNNPKNWKTEGYQNKS